MEKNFKEKLEEQEIIKKLKTARPWKKENRVCFRCCMAVPLSYFCFY